MAIYLKPRRGAQSTAKSQNIGLKKGEIFLEFPEGRIGREPGRIVIGDGASSYDHITYGSTSTNEFQPFITDPSIYTPRFVNTSTSTGEGQINPAFESINKIGNGSTAGEKLPTIIGAIKETLVYHANSLGETYKKFTNGFDIFGNGTTHSVGASKDKYTWVSDNTTYTNIIENDGISVSRKGSSFTDEAILNSTQLCLEKRDNNKIISIGGLYSNSLNFKTNSTTADYAYYGSEFDYYYEGALTNSTTVTETRHVEYKNNEIELNTNSTSYSAPLSPLPGDGGVYTGKISIKPLDHNGPGTITLQNASTVPKDLIQFKNYELTISSRDITKSNGWGASTISSLTDWVISRTTPEFITKSNEDLTKYINFTNLLSNVGDIAYINAIAIPSTEITITDNSYAGALIYAVRKSESTLNAFIMNSTVTGDYEVGSWRVVTNSAGTVGIILEVQSVYAPISATAMVIHSN